MRATANWPQLTTPTPERRLVARHLVAVHKNGRRRTPVGD
ncbi:hypothetical protein [Mycobacterium phage WXIN]|nr:hypothetical protein [Mycobacterium phage WXIN]